MELMQLNELLQVLMDIASDVEENYKEQLAASKRYTTNYGLIDSVRTEVSTADGGYEVVMHLNNYWKYVEEGTPPHLPPVDKILQWITIKPILPKPKATLPKPTNLDAINDPSAEQRSLAWAIAKKIEKKGTEGSHDLKKTLDAVLPYYTERIEAALNHDVAIYIRKVLATR